MDAEKPIPFERAADLVARQLTYFRSDEVAEPTENEKLMAGHIVGNLWANNLLNTDSASPPSLWNAEAIAWAVCPILKRNNDEDAVCAHCPTEILTSQGPGTQMCRQRANEVARAIRPLVQPWNEAIEACARWHDERAEIVMNSLHCGDNTSAIGRARRVSDFHHASAVAVRALKRQSGEG